jgi:hypothetical protein
MLGLQKKDAIEVFNGIDMHCSLAGDFWVKWVFSEFH